MCWRTCWRDVTLRLSCTCRQARDNALKELSAVKESLDITRSRNDWLENQMSDAKVDLERLRNVSDVIVPLHAPWGNV